MRLNYYRILNVHLFRIKSSNFHIFVFFIFFNLENKIFYCQSAYLYSPLQISQINSNVAKQQQFRRFIPANIQIKQLQIQNSQNKQVNADANSNDVSKLYAQLNLPIFMRNLCKSKGDHQLNMDKIEIDKVKLLAGKQQLCNDSSSSIVQIQLQETKIKHLQDEIAQTKTLFEKMLNRSSDSQIQNQNCKDGNDKDTCTNLEQDKKQKQQNPHFQDFSTSMKLYELEAQNLVLQNRVQSLEQINAIHAVKIQEYEEKFDSSAKLEIDNLSKTIESQKQGIALLNEQKESSVSEIENLRKLNSMQLQHIDELNTLVKTLQDQLRNNKEQLQKQKREIDDMQLQNIRKAQQQEQVVQIPLLQSKHPIKSNSAQVQNQYSGRQYYQRIVAKEKEDKEKKLKDEKEWLENQKQNQQNREKDTKNAIPKTEEELKKADVSRLSLYQKRRMSSALQQKMYEPQVPVQIQRHVDLNKVSSPRKNIAKDMLNRKMQTLRRDQTSQNQDQRIAISPQPEAQNNPMLQSQSMVEQRNASDVSENNNEEQRINTQNQIKSKLQIEHTQQDNKEEKAQNQEKVQNLSQQNVKTTSVVAKEKQVVRSPSLQNQEKAAASSQNQQLSQDQQMKTSQSVPKSKSLKSNSSDVKPPKSTVQSPAIQSNNMPIPPKVTTVKESQSISNKVEPVKTSAEQKIDQIDQLQQNVDDFLQHDNSHNAQPNTNTSKTEEDEFDKSAVITDIKGKEKSVKKSMQQDEFDQ